jgi:hypothetical protein
VVFLCSWYLDYLVILFPFSVQQTTIWYKAAKVLHNALWQTDLEKRLLTVDTGKDYLKYLPANEVKDLQLPELGCYDAILFREEYDLTRKESEKRQPGLGIGGVVVTGQPGIGMSVADEHSSSKAFFSFFLTLLSKHHSKP